jgi:single-stranded DNA-binding protein
MTRAIVSGALHKAAEERTSKAGKPFATFTIRENVNGSSRYFRAVAFDEVAIAVLKELSAGAPIAVAGEIDAEPWTPEDGRKPRLSWKVTADSVLSARRPKRRETTREVDDAPAF